MVGNMSSNRTVPESLSVNVEYQITALSILSSASAAFDITSNGGKTPISVEVPPTSSRTASQNKPCVSPGNPGESLRGSVGKGQPA